LLFKFSFIPLFYFCNLFFGSFNLFVFVFNLNFNLISFLCYITIIPFFFSLILFYYQDFIFL